MNKSIWSIVVVVICMVFIGFPQQAKAELTDSEGMPVVYLRGTFGHENWAPDNNYKFTREGNTYTLSITDRNPIPFDSKFKIADEDWNFDFGAPADDMYIDITGNYDFQAIGKNWRSNGIWEGVISFEYTGPTDILTVTFDLGDGVTPSVPGLSGTLPVLYINVYKDEAHNSLNNEIIDYELGHKEYFTYAEYWLDMNGCEWLMDLGGESIGSKEEPLPLQIKARGNWTRIGFSKKPFKIKLDKKQNLLGLTPEKSKHYALLAHADDNKGYMRNFIGFNLGERIGLPWTPGQQPIELVINGDYRGLYFLTESIRIGDGRIEINELDDNADDPELISGGYVVELDNYDEENQIRMDEKTFVRDQRLDVLRITYDTPEIYSEIQKRFVTEQFSAMNDAVGSNSNKLWEYLDLDDAVRYYLVREIISDVEAFHGSTYLYRDRGEGEKWHLSPLWDCGNAFNGWTTEYFYNCDPFGNTWIPSLRENKMFNAKLTDTWLWFMSNEYSGIEQDIEEYADHLRRAAIADRARWKNEPHPGGGQSVTDNTDMSGRLNEVTHHLNEKIEWLKGRWGDYTVGHHNEPPRDDTPAALLPDYAQSGIASPEVFDHDSPAEFYTLQGIKVNNPQPGEIYIVRQGSRSFKYIFR